MDKPHYFVACAVIFVSLLLHSCSSGDGASGLLDSGIDDWDFTSLGGASGTAVPAAGGNGVAGGNGGPVCGNGNIEIEADEECDGANLGNETCTSLGHGGGTLTCDPVSCRYNVDMCTNEPPSSGGYGG